MGWKPWEVRAASLNDFFLTFEGWKTANGLGEPQRLSPEEAAEIRAWAFGEEE